MMSIDERQIQTQKRMARQRQIDDSCVNSTWQRAVDVPLLEMCFAQLIPPTPAIMLPELRFRTLLQTTIECFPKVSKLMIVDESNYRFDGLRDDEASQTSNLYFSTQDLVALNYSEDVFHFVLTECGLPTLKRLELVLSEYRRVLRPDGLLNLALPLWGSFPAFFDLLDEGLFAEYPELATDIVDGLKAMMQAQAIENRLRQMGFKILTHEKSTFKLHFPDAGQLLFSSLAESHYLGYLLTLNEEELDAKRCLSAVVRAFHHYFQALSLDIPMHIGIYSLTKA